MQSKDVEETLRMHSDGREGTVQLRGEGSPSLQRVKRKTLGRGSAKGTSPSPPPFPAGPSAAQGTCARGAGLLIRKASSTLLPTLQTPGLLTPLPTAQPPPGLVSNQVIPWRSFTLFSVSERMRSC